ncbi:4182_t:CDS:2, partial [Entrophospora sp. SA101]
MQFLPCTWWQILSKPDVLFTKSSSKLFAITLHSAELIVKQWKLLCFKWEKSWNICDKYIRYSKIREVGRLLEEDDNKEVGIYNVEDNEGAIINHQIRKQIIIQDDLNQ